MEVFINGTKLTGVENVEAEVVKPERKKETFEFNKNRIAKIHLNRARFSKEFYRTVRKLGKIILAYEEMVKLNRISNKSKKFRTKKKLLKRMGKLREKMRKLDTLKKEIN